MRDKSQLLEDEYHRRFGDRAEYRDRVWKVLCAEFFSRYVPRDAVVLDLGAGWGEFTRNVHAREKYAMDLNPETGRRVEGFARFLRQDCSKPWPLADAALDVVFTSNFLEHLPAKELVDDTLREARRCLKPGGRIVCVGPNVRYVPGAYWDFWDHHIPITDLSMAEALELQGFAVEERVDRFLPYTMSGNRETPLALVRAYLKMRFAWPFFGKQFLVVARKA
ncbi:MAG TPA: class I SAM-dependent methyltransferase [Usitatibacter sp.]|nr:class I SAM-dependent methyltransferase [Usitatibacter sp.]